MYFMKCSVIYIFNKLFGVELSIYIKKLILNILILMKFMLW